MFHRVPEASSWARRSEWLHASIAGRFVSLIAYKKRVYCIDSVCYHAGGPLAVGEIEEIDGRPCVRCPWHHYAITIDTGEKLHKALEMNSAGKLVPAGWKRCVRELSCCPALAPSLSLPLARPPSSNNAACRIGSERTPSRSARMGCTLGCPRQQRARPLLTIRTAAAVALR